MSRGGTTLYVTGFSHGTRARDLAYEFERNSHVDASVRPVLPGTREPSEISDSSSPSLAPPAHRPRLLVLPSSSAAPASAYQYYMPPSPSVPVDASSSPRSLASARATNPPPVVRAALTHEATCLALPSPPGARLFVSLNEQKDQNRENKYFIKKKKNPEFAFVEYEDRRDADDAYHEMHNKRIGRDDILKIEWARTPPSASWRFDSGRDRERAPRRSSPRRGRSPSPRRSTRDYSPRKDDRRDRDRDYDRERRDTRDRSRSPDRRDRDAKDDRDERDHRENGTNGDDRKAIDSPPPAHDDLDVAAE
ncbi:Pre-mRNA-splicing factor srp1 [Colletotrichum gloeosporioides]|uniref:Pre-mRNA-splicing factor srp1 n=1 Tax=Colletotrichum gloeosporioides TaxID=474922 RepID=A0A8H4FCP1_COLGL|nr:Pre-mRNA-splicing factor srp1 [Colletotrichum gloeosporioides]KAF3797778.1 Pre-mRNA-splicing factor srp1 [Colletotrichum gloeosporioides]